jgi:hypothetical protein
MNESCVTLYLVPANHSLKLTENTACFFAARHEFTNTQNITARAS